MGRWFFVLCVFSLSAWAEPVRIAPKFVKGEKFSLEIKKTRENSRASRPTGTTTTQVDVEVLETSERGSTLGWVHGETSFSDPAQANHPLLQATGKVARGIRYELNLNADGELTGLRNQKEVEARLSEVADVMMQKILEGFPEAQRQQTRAVLTRVLSPAVLAASSTRDAALLFGLSGAEVDEGKPVRVNLDTPNPLGAGTIPSVLEVRVEKVDPEKKEATLGMRQDFDSSAMPDLLKTLLPPDTPLDPAKMPKFEMYDTAEYLIDTTSARVKRVRHLRTISTDGLQRRDITELTTR